jgi:glycosyltransferase involved in cell wall biosynthesis
MSDISVVLSTYKNEKPSNLEEAIDSIIYQSLKPREIVIVIDGPIPGDQEKVIEAEREKSLANGITFVIKRLEKNVGRSRARNEAVAAASSDIIAFMDSDDISYKDRLQIEYEIIMTGKYDVISSWVDEFNDETKQPTGTKKCPRDDLPIKRTLKYRCLMPNPSLMMKKELFLKQGGYPTEQKYVGEDHLLFINMAISGVKFYCVQKSLLNIRTNLEQRKRRGGIKVIRDLVNLRKSAFKAGFLNIFEFIVSNVLAVTFTITPHFLKDIFFKLDRR